LAKLIIYFLLIPISSLFGNFISGMPVFEQSEEPDAENHISDPSNLSNTIITAIFLCLCLVVIGGTELKQRYKT
jgi:hypothetical protein